MQWRCFPGLLALAASQEFDVGGQDGTTSTFLELARERFEARNVRSPTLEGDTFALDRLQLVRVPKAGSSEASVIARRLGGCVPRGPCCMMPGHPPGSCPSEGLMYPADYESCFEEMMNTTKFQNVAARMVSGHDAYEGSVKLCMNKDQDVGGEAACAEDLESVIKRACNLNFVTMCEAWASSVLLLFETLPWLEPTADFFPAPRDRHRQLSSSKNAKEGAAAGPQRQNTGSKHEEGIKHITPELRDAARSANAVDEALHEFVSAKFCERLRETGLLHHPLVGAELATYEPLERRCNDETWAKDTLERFAPIMPDECRLYQPFDKQQ
ncbi:unnamed protein product [Ectocarpus sp. 6 AP-2014]